jgi:hypothetical protein
MFKAWKDKGKYFNSYGVSNILAVVNSKYVLTVKIFNFSFGWSKDLKRFI